MIDDSGHSWCIALKKLIQEAEHERKQLMENGYMSFDDEYIREFNRQLDELLEKADEEYLTSSNRYFETDERRLIARLKKYRKNYFMWLSDFSLPTTNNLSERSLRFAKTKQKVSGQFVSQKYSEYFADIRTYIETCYRNGVNCFKALSRLAASNPYTLLRNYQAKHDLRLIMMRKPRLSPWLYLLSKSTVNSNNLYII